jgi:hypothetical protein
MIKNYLILLVAISAAGFISGIYIKYYKTYQSSIEVVKTNDDISIQRQLNLGENIAFLEEIDKIFAATTVERIHTDKLPEALERLKAINRFSIGLIMTSGYLFLWSVQQLFKKHAVSAHVNQI